MGSAFEAAEDSYNMLCVSSVSSPIYRVYRKISRNTSFFVHVELCRGSRDLLERFTVVGKSVLGGQILGEGFGLGPVGGWFQRKWVQTRV